MTRNTFEYIIGLYLLLYMVGAPLYEMATASIVGYYAGAAILIALVFILDLMTDRNA